MKKTLLVVACLVASNVSLAQKKDTTKKQDNFLDLASKSITQILGKDLDGKPSKKGIGYLDLLEKSNLPSEQKKEYKSWYYLQSKKQLTQKQKDSLGKALEKKILEAEKNPSSKKKNN